MAAGMILLVNIYVLIAYDAFHIHTALGQSEILQFFLNTLEEKTDIDVLDHIHATPAHDAAEYGQKEAMILLLKHGASVNIKDTVSFNICDECQQQYLLSLSLSIWSKYQHVFDHVPQENKTPYELAMEQNHTEVANMIADYRENGPTILAKYEKKKYSQPSRDPPSSEQVGCVWQIIHSNTLLLLYNRVHISVSSVAGQ